MQNQENWIPYDDGIYEKRFCYIKLKNGKILGPCWPNAGTFHVLTPDADAKRIDREDVTSIRYLTEEERKNFF